MNKHIEFTAVEVSGEVFGEIKQNLFNGILHAIDDVNQSSEAFIDSEKFELTERQIEVLNKLCREFALTEFEMADYFLKKIGNDLLDARVRLGLAFPEDIQAIIYTLIATNVLCRIVEGLNAQRSKLNLNMLTLITPMNQDIAARLERFMTPTMDEVTVELVGMLPRFTVEMLVANYEAMYRADHNFQQQLHIDPNPVGVPQEKIDEYKAFYAKLHEMYEKEFDRRSMQVPKVSMRPKEKTALVLLNGEKIDLN